MSRKPQSIKRRAASYASGKRNAGTYTAADEQALAEGWEDGYSAALRDVKQVARGLIEDTRGALSKSLDATVGAAAEIARSELEELQ